MPGVATAPLERREGGDRRSPPSFLVDLRRDLIAELMLEVELTLKVAVMSAAGLSRPQITQALKVSDIETRMAVVRLERVASSWGR